MNRPGHTLIELLWGLILLAALAAIALPRLGGWLDAAAVRAAREEVAGALARTRMAATTHGGAGLVLDPRTGRFWIGASDGWRTAPTSLTDRYRVQLDVGSADLVVLPYDALGIGRLTSRTVRIRRGDATAGVTVSAYGRIRRW